MSTKGRPTKKSKWKVVFNVIHQEDGPDKLVFDRYDGSWEHVDKDPKYLEREETKMIPAVWDPPMPDSDDYDDKHEFYRVWDEWYGDSSKRKLELERWEKTGKMTGWWSQGVKYVDPFEWDDEFTFLGYGRGRSAAYFEWETKYGKMQMFMTDMSNLLKSATIKNGVVSGRWGFRKFGANVGVCYLGPINDPTTENN
jgi:hypothetical protein